MHDQNIIAIVVDSNAIVRHMPTCTEPARVAREGEAPGFRCDCAWHQDQIVMLTAYRPWSYEVWPCSDEERLAS